MKENRKWENIPSDDYFDDTSVVSSTECTGLGIIMPFDEDEAESFRQIYDIPLGNGEVAEIQNPKREGRSGE